MEEKDIPKRRFEAEMTRKIDLLIQKTIGLETGFNGLETRFDGLETRFDGLETRFGGLETRFDGLETRFDGLETRFDNLEKDVSEIKTDVSEIKTDVKVLSGQFNDVAVMAIQDNQRITKLESDVTELQSNIH